MNTLQTILYNTYQVPPEVTSLIESFRSSAMAERITNFEKIFLQNSRIHLYLGYSRCELESCANDTPLCKREEKKRYSRLRQNYAYTNLNMFKDMRVVTDNPIINILNRRKIGFYIYPIRSFIQYYTGRILEAHDEDRLVINTGEWFYVNFAFPPVTDNQCY